MRKPRGTGSRGNGGRYWYHHCHRCGKVRFRAEEAHEDLSEHLSNVQMAPEVVKLYRHILDDLTRSQRDDQRKAKDRFEAQITQLEDKLFAVDEAYIERRIEGDSYARLKERYASELREKRAELAHMEENGSNLAEKLSFAMSLLSDISGIFERASITARREMLVRIWPDHLVYENGSFRTNSGRDIIALLAPKTAKMKDARGPKAHGVSSG